MNFGLYATFTVSYRIEIDIGLIGRVNSRKRRIRPSKSKPRVPLSVVSRTSYAPGSSDTASRNRDEIRAEVATEEISLDPFDSLPDEILLNIFERLPLRYRIKAERGV